MSSPDCVDARHVQRIDLSLGSSTGMNSQRIGKRSGSVGAISPALEQRQVRRITQCSDLWYPSSKSDRLLIAGKLLRACIIAPHAPFGLLPPAECWIFLPDGRAFALPPGPWSGSLSEPRRRRGLLAFFLQSTARPVLFKNSSGVAMPWSAVAKAISRGRRKALPAG